jgi:Zn-dependent protease
MNELRKSLGYLFGFVAITLALDLLASFTRAIRSPHLGAGPTLAGWFDIGTAFLVASCILNASACWAVLRNNRLARILGTATSIMPFLGILAFVIIGLIYHAAMPPSGLMLMAFALAVAGLIAFLPRSAGKAAQAASTPPASTPIPGDGTNKWINKSILIVGFVLFFVLLDKWWPWARANGLSPSGVRFFILQLVLAELAVVFLHELGHTLTSLALGMKLRAFNVGPFIAQIRDGKWEFKFRLANFFTMGGATGLVPTDPHQPLSYDICMIAAGPFVNVITGLLVFAAAIAAPGSAWQSAWFLLAATATLSLTLGVLNLVPFQTGSAYSDGAYLYQLISGNVWADFYRIVSLVTSSLVTPLRPRDYDINAIQRTVLSINHGMRAMLLHLYATSYYMDQVQLTPAAHAFTQAEALYDEVAALITAELHTAFVFRKAFLHRDAAGTRLWWNRLEAKKPTRFNADYWLARAALHWIENSPAEANAAWEKARDLAQKLPPFGAYEFDRYRCTLLRHAIDESATASSQLPLATPALQPDTA